MRGFPPLLLRHSTEREVGERRREAKEKEKEKQQQQQQSSLNWCGSTARYFSLFPSTHSFQFNCTQSLSISFSSILIAMRIGGLGDLLLLVFFFFLCLSPPPTTTAQSTSPRTLDSLLQDYAFRAFVNPRTGVPYNAPVPSNLTGIRISAIRLRSGSLRTRGLDAYNEFRIPVGVVVTPYVQRLVLVYQNLANWSSLYYHLPGYTYLTPVLGLLAYDASNLSAKNLPQLDIKPDSDAPIFINFAHISPVPQGSTARCVWFDLDGLTQFSNVSSGNVCSTLDQGHFSIVAESSTTTTPAPPPPPIPPPSPQSSGGGGTGDEDHNSRVWIIVGSVVGGLVFIALLGLLFAWVRRYKRRNRMLRMEKAAEVGESLNMTSVGNTRAPVAMVTRTQPTIENEYVP